MNDAQKALTALDVSSPDIKRLVNAARGVGALGAKLSGAGRGGNVIALAGDEAAAERIRKACIEAGATDTCTTVLARRPDQTAEATP